MQEYFIINDEKSILLSTFLSGNLSGLYSRRINRQHRIVYEVVKENHEIHIIRMWTHYDNL